MRKEKDVMFRGFAGKFVKLKDSIKTFEFKSFYKKSIEDLRDTYKDINLKLKDLNSTNFELGVHHYANCNIYDAKFRFWFYNKFWHTKAEANYFLGRSYFELGDKKNAEVCLKEYLATENQSFRNEAEYTLKVIKGETDSINDIPQVILIHNYDRLALSKHEAEIPKYIASEIASYLEEIAKPIGNKFLDIGCGSGYIGHELKNLKAADYCFGVDFSEKACANAIAQEIGGSKSYNRVLNKSFEDYCGTEDKINYDVIAFGILEAYKDSYSILQKFTQLNSLSSVVVFEFATAEDDIAKFDFEREVFRHSEQTITQQLTTLGWKVARRCELVYSEGNKGICLICTKI